MWRLLCLSVSKITEKENAKGPRNSSLHFLLTASHFMSCVMLALWRTKSFSKPVVSHSNENLKNQKIYDDKKRAQNTCIGNTRWLQPRKRKLGFNSFTESAGVKNKCDKKVGNFKCTNFKSVDVLTFNINHTAMFTNMCIPDYIPVV